MMRILWKRKLALIASCVLAFVFLEMILFDKAKPAETDPGLRQILQLKGDKQPVEKVKVDEAGVTDNASKKVADQPSPDELIRRAGNITTAALRLPTGAPVLLGDALLTEPDLPSVYNYLPHLRGKDAPLSPAVALSKGKTNVSIVIGIPSIRRPLTTYIYDTLQSLFSGMDAADRADVLVIVCLTEPWNTTYQTEIKDNLEMKFSRELKEGVLELLVPKADYYPNLSLLPLTLGDKPERVRWRSKQNLDYAYLMMHAASRGQYYLQLEDDVIATKGFVTSMKKSIAMNRGSWFLLEFSALGFIGRLFHSSDVSSMSEFLLMFYAQKPCDWLMEDYLQVRMCGHGEKWAKCLYKIRSVARPIRPSLFQHSGYRSSLEGKVNKLKDKHFNKNTSVASKIPNPPVANIFTSLKAYANDVYDAYMGEKIFWALNPKDADIVEFMFYPGVAIDRIQITTGDERHKTDILTDAVIEALPATALSRSALPNPGKKEVPKHKVHKQAWDERQSVIPDLKETVKDAIGCETAFIVVGQFQASGAADVALPREIGPVWSVRIRVTAPSQKWLVIKKISITERLES